MPLEELRAREEALLKKFICDRCGAGFTTTIQLETHRNNNCQLVESKLPWLASCQCDKCNRFFATINALEKHQMRNCMEQKKFNEMPADLKCPKCDKMFKVQKFLDKHLPSHDRTTAPRNFKCPQCDNLYTSANAVKQHVLRVHEKVYSYFCRYCSKGFYQAGDRCQHERFKHTNEKPWACRICDYACVTVKDLRRHAWKHGIRDDEARFQREVAVKVVKSNKSRMRAVPQAVFEIPDQVEPYPELAGNVQNYIEPAKMETAMYQGWI